MELDLTEIIQNNSIILCETINITEYMCVLNTSDLITFTETWKYNRKINQDKVEEIKKYIKHKLTLDSVLYFYMYNNKLICYDGNHRLQSLADLYTLHNLNIKVCCFITIPVDPLNIDVEIRDKFKLLNQNTPIPDIYLEIVNNLDKNDSFIQRKDIIEETFNEYKIKYKEYYKTSNKPRKPHFNETIFKDLCNELNFNNKKELECELKTMNKLKKKKKMTTMIEVKCDLQEFYLFN